MLKKSCPVVAILVSILLLAVKADAQTTDLEKATDVLARKAIAYLNKGLPDSVYALSGTSIKKQFTPQLWRSVYQNNISPLLPISKVTFLSSKESVNKYELKGNANLWYYVSLDKEGKLKDFLFQPAPEAAKVVEMRPQQAKTDSLARILLKLINHRQTDSIYALAGDAFKKQINAATFKNISENALFKMLPLPDPIFINSKNGVNKYKLNQLQFIISLDDEGKFSTFAFQPYQEDAVKTTRALSDNPMKTHVDSVVNKVLSAYIQTKGNVGLSAGVYYKGKTLFYNYGETRQGSAQLPGSNTLYDIGSITKTFTSTLLAIAVGEGKVKLTTPITKLLPDSVAGNPALKGITLKQLANHTSGFPRMPENITGTLTDSNQPYANYGTKDMFSFLKNFKSIRKPGESYEYSNFGAGLLGVLLERIYHTPYQALIHKYITGPAKLNSTYFTVNTVKPDLVAQGYNEQVTAVPGWEFLAFEAAGALKSSSSDLLNYGKLQLNSSSSSLSPALKLTHQITFNNSQNVVGLGWNYLPEDHNVLQHGGGTAGFRSMLCADLKKSIVVAVLTNNASTGDATGLYLMKALQAIDK